MTLRTLTVHCPLPPQALSPNARVDRREKAEAVMHYRETCAALVRGAMGERFGPPMRRAVLSLTFVFGEQIAGLGRYKPRDADNALAALKGAIDSFVQARALIDDRWECLALGGCRLDRTVQPQRWRDGEVIAVLNEQE